MDEAGGVDIVVRGRAQGCHLFLRTSEEIVSIAFKLTGI